MKVIFLDIDGVLNSDEYFDSISDDVQGIEREIDIEKVKLVKKIIDETGAKIVLTSSWRYTRNAIELEKLFFNYGLSIVKTPFIENERGIEIKKWISENDDIEDYAIIDDEIFDTFDEELKSKLIKISTGNGITFGEGLLPKDCIEVVKRLGKIKQKNRD